MFHQPVLIGQEIEPIEDRPAVNTVETLGYFFCFDKWSLFLVYEL